MNSSGAISGDGKAWRSLDWGPQGGYNVKNSPLEMPLAIHVTTGGKQVEFQGKAWPGDINLGPISL